MMELMPQETIDLFLGLLTMVGAVAIVGTFLALLVRLVGGPKESLTTAAASIQPIGIRAALAIAAAAMGTSLYYSEIVGFDPCRLCWVQRTFMYPIVFVLLLALRWPKAAWVAFALAVPGMLVASFHRFEQQYPDMSAGGCDPSNPCSGRWVDTFGFITIPTMAAVAFGLIVLLIPLGLLGPRRSSQSLGPEAVESLDSQDSSDPTNDKAGVPV